MMDEREQRPVKPRRPQNPMGGGNQASTIPANPADIVNTPDLMGPQGPANGNTGVATPRNGGGPPPVNPGGTTPPPAGVPPVPPPALPPAMHQTTLMEGDPGKLSDPNHALKSPKYSFLQLAQQNKYGYDDLDKMLAELQGTHPDFWQGWRADGDKLLYGGDPGQLHEAWNGATEVDAIGNYTSEDGSAPLGWRWGHNVIDPATQGGGGGTTPTPGGGGGGMPPIQDLLGLFGDLGGEYGGPQGPGVFPDDNLQQVGQDPFSQLITGALSGLIGSGGQGYSQTGQDVSAALSGLLNPGAGGGMNQDILNARMESAREGSERFRSSEMDFLESELSERGILNDGAMGTAIGGLSQDISGQHATALRDIFADEAGRADDRFMGALDTGAQMAQGHERNLLDATSQGTERQNVLANIAMDSLDQNMEWQQFISTFGLSRDQLMNDIQMGRMDRVIELLQLFTQQAGIGAGGYI